MFARVLSIQGIPRRTASPEFMERAVEMVQKQPGFKGIYLLADQNTGESLGISLWETEEQAKTIGRSRAATQFRTEAAEAAGAATAPTAKVYEVIAQA